MLIRKRKSGFPGDYDFQHSVFSGTCAREQANKRVSWKIPRLLFADISPTISTFVVLLALLGCSSTMQAATGAAASTAPATISASSCSSSAVQSAIDSANSGDTVVVPGGSCSWSSVTIPSTKGITLDGGGKTTIAGATALVVNSNSSVGTRVTGFTFTGAGQSSSPNILLNGNSGSAYYRIDDNIFDVGGNTDVVYVSVGGNGPGLIDHNTFKGGGASEEIHNFGLGPSSEAGWKDNVTPGSPQMVYVEDNNFDDYDTSLLCSGIQSYYGARTVVRHNTFSFCVIDQHGSKNMIGARWWEIYNNTFDVPANQNQCCDIIVRDGSGVIFDNHQVLASGSRGGGIELYSDNTGAWPLAWQIGAGINDYTNGYTPCKAATGGAGTGLNSSPAYVWGNDASMNVNTNGNPSNTVFINQDFIVSATKPTSIQLMQRSGDTCSTTFNYAPFTYPFPLNSSGLPDPSASSKSPASPSNLSGSVQ